MKIFEKLKALFTKKVVVETPEVDQITERLIDVSTKPLVRVEEPSCEVPVVEVKPSVKEIKSKSTKKPVVKEEVKTEKPKVSKKAAVKKPKS